RDDAQLRLHAGQCRFDFKILAGAIFVGPDLAHGFGTENIAEYAGVDDCCCHDGVSNDEYDDFCVRRHQPATRSRIALALRMTGRSTIFPSTWMAPCPAACAATTRCAQSI